MEPWIIVMTHGRFGQELIKSAEMILGTLHNCYALSLLEEMDPFDLKEQLDKLLENAPQNSIILCDLFGGTPANMAATVALNEEYSVFSGLNLPMLIEVEMLRKQNETDYANKIEELGHKTILNIRKIMQERKDNGRN